MLGQMMQQDRAVPLGDSVSLSSLTWGNFTSFTWKMGMLQLAKVEKQKHRKIEVEERKEEREREREREREKAHLYCLIQYPNTHNG